MSAWNYSSYRWSRFLSSARSWSVDRGAHIQAFTFSPRWNSLKITVGCRLCTYPSILLSPDEDTLKITVGCPSCTYPSIRTKTCRHVGLHGPRGKHATRADACACAGVPQPRLFEFITSLWHSGHYAEITKKNLWFQKNFPRENLSPLQFLSIRKNISAIISARMVLSCSSPLSGLSQIKVDVLRSWSHPESFIVPSALGNMNCPPFMCVNTSFESLSTYFRCVYLFQFLNVCDHYVSFPDSSRIQHISKEYTWQDFRTKLM